MALLSEDLVSVITKLFERNTSLCLSDYEPIQIQKYSTFDEYKIHYDAKDIYEEGEGSVNQRVNTMIIYLNDDFSGGQTEFPLKEVSVSPKKGSALIFSNCFKDSLALHPLSAHKSCPVESGEKWIMTIWSRNDLIKDLI